MTKDKIGIILNNISEVKESNNDNYFNTILSLDNVQRISLQSDGNVFNTPNTRFNFCTEYDGMPCELLLVYLGFINSDGNFIMDKNPSAFIPFSSIEIFVMKNVARGI